MAEVHPFRGILYNPAKIVDYRDVVAPPYDVISPTEQERLYEKSPYNVVRLILGKEFATDDHTDNRYTRAAKYFMEWQAKNILVRDPEPSLYCYSQEFLAGGKIFTREGFFALVRLEEYEKRIIIPHERTLSGPKVDRLNLMRSCQANFSPVFLLYPDSRDEVIRQLKSGITGGPLIEVRDGNGVLQRFYRVSDSCLLSTVAGILAKEPLFIADGHHRYETALAYRNEQREKMSGFTGRESFNYMMMYLTPLEGSGLAILPYHRVLHSLPDFAFSPFEKKVKETFEVESFPFRPENEEGVKRHFLKGLEERGRGGYAFGLYARGVDAYSIISLRADEEKKLSGTSPVSRLDVTILESLIVNRILGITSERLREQKNIEYVHDSEEAVHLVREKGCQLAVILNPTKIEEVLEVALKGETMPQKSTYFYPKLLSGLVINRFDPEEEIA